jgi:hypothetical protein
VVKKIQPLVFKFIGVTNRYPKRSREDLEAYYNRVHLIFLKENEGEKSFDVYHPAWEYLQDKPKFSALDDNTEQPTEKIMPIGRNSMKRKMEEDKILEAVSQ